MFIKLLSFRSAVVDHQYIISALSSLFGHSNIYQNVSIVYSAHFPSFTFSLWFNLKILVRTKMQVKSCFWLFQKINNVSNYLKSILRKVNVGLEDKESYSSQAQSYLDAVCTIQSQSLPCLLIMKLIANAIWLQSLQWELGATQDWKFVRQLFLDWK